MATYRTIPSRVKALLEEGEHPLVDYKKTIPDDLAKAFAGGANTVAVLNSDQCFSILLGVDEEVAPSGLRCGRPVGFRDPKTGASIDLDKIEQQALSKAKAVFPIPDIEVERVGTSGARPFLVLRVRPSDAPHRVDDRYPIRRGSQSQPLERGQIEELILRKRTQAVLAELGDDSPVTRAVSDLAQHILALSEELNELAFELGTASGRDQSMQEVGQQTLAEAIQKVQDVGQENQERLDELKALIEGELAGTLPDTVWGALAEIRQSTRITSPEEAYLTAAGDRHGAWRQLRRQQALGADPVAVDLIERLLTTHFGAPPMLTGYPANLGEITGWRQLRRAVVSPEAELTKVYDLGWAACWAAVGRLTQPLAGVLPPTFGPDREAEDLLQDLIETDLADLDMFRSSESEAAIIDARPSAVRRFVEASTACFTPPGQPVVGWLLQSHEVRFGFPEAEGPVAVVAQPTLGGRSRPEPHQEVRRLRARLRRSGSLMVVRCHPRRGGLLARLAGER